MPHAPLAARTRSPHLRVFLLGAFRLEPEITGRASRTTTRQHADPLYLPTRKIELLFAYLLLHPKPHPREQLAALLWGDVADVLARTSLRRAFVLLCQALGEYDRAIDFANQVLHRGAANESAHHTVMFCAATASQSEGGCSAECAEGAARLAGAAVVRETIDASRLLRTAFA